MNVPLPMFAVVVAIVGVVVRSFSKRISSSLSPEPFVSSSTGLGVLVVVDISVVGDDVDGIVALCSPEKLAS